MKNIIQRNLPLSQTYSLLETFYSSLEEGGGTCCENCGRPISNIAKVQGNHDKNVYYIGMDCAETLTGIKDDYFGFEQQAKAAFAAAKQARAAIMKLKKKCEADSISYKITATTFEDEKNYFKEVGSGVYRVNSEPFNPRYSTFKQFPKAQWEKHVLPMIKDLLTEK